MSFTHDALTTGSGATDPVTVSHTASSGTKLIKVDVFSDTSARSGGVPTWNTTENLTDSSHGSVNCTAGKLYLEVFYILSPTTGTHSISVPNTATNSLVVNVTSFEASGTVTKHTSNSAEAATADPSLNLTITTAGLVTGSLTHDANALPAALTPGTNYTEDYEADYGTEGGASEYDLLSGTGTVAVDWTCAADDWGIIAIAFEEAAGGATLTVADVAHTNSLDATGALVQVHNIQGLADISHTNQLDAFALIQDYLMTVADISHTHQLDATGKLIQDYLMTVAEISHTHQLDAASPLTQVHNLVIAEISHTNQLDAVVLVYGAAATLVVADISHTHQLDATGKLIQDYLMTLADIEHTNTLDAASPLVQVHNLQGVADLAHTNTLDAAGVLAQIHNLVVGDVSHTNQLDSVSLTQAQLLVIASLLHTHQLDGVSFDGDQIILLVRPRSRWPFWS